MHEITFISTIHKELGKCNANELCEIIKKIKPEVIFLEALANTYSRYDKSLFSSFGIKHNKLEIKSIQEYSYNNSYKYIPVLDAGLTDSFTEKYNIVCENKQIQNMINKYNLLISDKGFPFLNSNKSIYIEDGMRIVENKVLNNKKMENKFKMDIETYENSMLRNIYKYCKDNIFQKAIFMCGVAHRKSIIEKINANKDQYEININWKILGN
jgi:hypothetical protein